jgi:transposase-like protein
MSVLRGHGGMADSAGPIAVRGMPAANVGNRGNDLRRYAEAVAALVPGDVVRDEPEARGQCVGGATHSCLGSYQTAWAWLHKLRRAMVRPGRDLLNGEVEVDETYVGGRETGVAGRQTNKKSIVVIAAEIQGRGTGRIRMARVHDVSAESLVSFVQTAVSPDATIRTDGWAAYSGLAKGGYDHQPKSISASGDPAHVVMPRVHQVASLLDRWWLGIHHGAIDASHLDYYLDEFTFRFNRRRSRARGLLFFRLLQQALQRDPTPYKALVGGNTHPARKI